MMALATDAMYPNQASSRQWASRKQRTWSNAKPRQHAGEVFRQRTFDFEPRLRLRMFQLQRGGVEKEAGQRRIAAAAVEGIAHHRGPDRGQVGPDLVEH